MAALLAALSAITFGISDFFGGIAARRTVVFASTLVAQASGLIVLVVLAFVIGGDAAWSDWVWGFAAGGASGFAILLFYWSLSAGQMSVVAPVAALTSAIVPVTVGIGRGDRPSVAAIIGITLALPAIVLISREPTEPDAAGVIHPAPRQFLSAPVIASLVAGAGFGFFFVAIGSADHDSGVWPLVAARLVGTTIVGILWALRRVGPPASDAVPPAVAAGTLEAMANGLQIIAIRSGLLSLIGVISALYPASTVVMAQIFLKERMARHQQFGLALAAVAVIIVAAAS